MCTFQLFNFFITSLMVAVVAFAYFVGKENGESKIIRQALRRHLGKYGIDDIFYWNMEIIEHKIKTL